ncbi:MAG: SIMPL domain-containing protein [Halioglobus sp.]
MAHRPNFRRAGVLIAIFVTLFFSVLTAADGDDIQPAIRVTGEGTAQIAPDMAVLDLTVSREAATAREALDANSAAMKQVLGEMRRQGVEDRDLQTSNFSIQPKYVYPSPKSSGEREPPKIVGYTVRNTLTMRVRDISRVGDILDKSVTLGVNEGGNIRFANNDPSAAIDQARVDAVHDAMAKAKTLAGAAGVKIGRLLELSEQSLAPRAVPIARAEMMMSRAADSVPVATGENSYKVQVSVSYAIDPS